MSDTLAPAAHGPAPPPGTRIRTLRGLAGYRCGHSGACCRAGWPIPVEPPVLAALKQAELDGTLPRAAPGASWLAPGNVLGRTPEEACVFHGRAATSSCGLEQALGASSLPVSCRQFPRILLVDARGWQQSLSGWCVTAARAIVSGSDDFLSFDTIDVDARVHVEALDARDAWPPFLRPGVLAGHEEYDTIERRLLGECRRAQHSGARASWLLHRMLLWAEPLRQWRPDNGPLLRACEELSFSTALATLEARGEPAADLSKDLIARIPPSWRPTAWPNGLTSANEGGAALTRSEAEAALVRYVGTRLVASWVAYQGEGVRSVLASLVSSYALAVEALTANGSGPVTFGRLTSAIRAADWLQLHLVDRDVWATWCAQWESGPDANPLHRLVAGASRRLDALPWRPPELPGAAATASD